jgi:glyoxylase I family protein
VVAVSTTTATDHRTDADPVVIPQIQGISHLGLTVGDLDQAVDFWCTVMGFQLAMQGEGYCMVWHPSATLAIGLTAHDGTAIGPFDEHRVGLDHVALAVSDVEALTDWADRFAARSLPCSPVIETDAGYHLNLRAPDNLAIELFVIKAEFAAGNFGMEVGVGTAGTHT